MSGVSRISSAFGTFGWGLFCACSWTWCIGLFLPAILLQRFGWWGFFIFAIPNVLGCAAFGYVIATRERSESMVRKHRGAMRWFSVATVAFHLFFLSFVLLAFVPKTAGNLTLVIPLTLAIYGVGVAVSFLRDRVWPWLAVLIYGVSLGAFFETGFAPLEQIAWSGEQSLLDLAYLSPVIFAGFALCPYLDLTFHRALQRSPSRHAFAVFGVTFAVMLVLTAVLWNVGETITGPLIGTALVHVLAQSLFTVGAHVREIREVSGKRKETSLLLLLPLAAIPLGVLPLAWRPLWAGEGMYLRFMVFYGLVFPAYVLLFVSMGEQWKKSPAARLRYLAFVVLSLPIFELAFIHRQAWTIVLPVIAIAVFFVWTQLKPAGKLRK